METWTETYVEHASTFSELMVLAPRLMEPPSRGSTTCMHPLKPC